MWTLSSSLILFVSFLAVSQAFMPAISGCINLEFCRPPQQSPSSTVRRNAMVTQPFAKSPVFMIDAGKQIQKMILGLGQKGPNFPQCQATGKFRQYSFNHRLRAGFVRDCSVSSRRMSQQALSFEVLRDMVVKNIEKPNNSPKRFLDAVLPLAGETVRLDHLSSILERNSWKKEIKEAGGIAKFCLLHPQRFDYESLLNTSNWLTVVTIKGDNDDGIGGLEGELESSDEEVRDSGRMSQELLSPRDMRDKIDALKKKNEKKKKDSNSPQLFLDAIVSLAGATVLVMHLGQVPSVCGEKSWKKEVKAAGGIVNFCLLHPHRFHVETRRNEEGKEVRVVTIKGDNAEDHDDEDGIGCQGGELESSNEEGSDYDSESESGWKGQQRVKQTPSSVKPSSFSSTKKRVHLIQTAAQLAEVISNDPSLQASGSAHTVAIDAEGVPDALLLVQVATSEATYVFDCLVLGPKAVCSALEPMLSSLSILKLFHDLTQDVLAFARFGGVERVSGTLDTQLVMEYLTGDLYTGFNAMLKHLGCQTHPSKRAVHRQLELHRLQRSESAARTSSSQAGASPSPFAQRPLPADLLQYAADDVELVLSTMDHIRSILFLPEEDSDAFALLRLQHASDRKAAFAVQSNGSRSVCFDTANSHALASSDLLTEIRPADIASSQAVFAEQDTDDLFSRLPEDIARTLGEYGAGLTEVVLDIGRRPSVWSGGQRSFPCESSRVVAQSDIDEVLAGGVHALIGSDGRVTLDQQLHRISAVRDRGGSVIGLTIRIGRCVMGVTGMMISDLLDGGAKSVLLLGPPSSGKTTVLRDAARFLAETRNVCIVDASNEIAGDGIVPHSSVGMARRMMVASPEEQASVMVEAIQNHAPDVVVVDEIGRADQVMAAETCRRRGVSLVASAHGSLRDILKNKELAALLGGVQTVTVGDRRAADREKEASDGQANGKLERVRTANPVFDAVVEMDRSRPYEWRVVADAELAVDTLLRGRGVTVQRRRLDAETGLLSMHLEKMYLSS